MKKITHLFLLFGLLFLLISLSSSGATITSAQTGNWSDSTTWAGGVIPVSDDDVVIADGHIVSISSTQSVASLTINATDGSNYGTLIIKTGASLSTTGTTTVYGKLNIEDGTFNEGDTSGDYLYINGSYSLISISGGTLNTSRYFNMKNNASFTMSGGTLNINSNGGTSSTAVFYIPNGSIFTMSLGTIDILNGNLGSGDALKFNPSTSNVTGGTIKFTNVKGYNTTTMSIGNTLYDIVCDVKVGDTLLIQNETSPSSVACHDFTITSGIAQIDPGEGLTVNGTLTNSGTAANLVITSDTTGTGSLIVASGTPDATVNRYLTAYSNTTAADGWHFLSAPVSGFTIAGSVFVPASGTDDLYRFDEGATTTTVWLNYLASDFVETQFQVGEGYLVAYATAATKSFTGPINTGAKTLNVNFTSGANAAAQGWNLLGNPYTSAIDWDLLTKSSNDISGTVYVYNATNQVYDDWNGSAGDLTDGIIPAMQGFFVNTTAAATITTETTDQVHSSTGFYKSTNALAAQTIKISLSNAEFNNNTYIQLRDGATKGFDNAIDGYKLFGFGSAPELYTQIDNTKYSINCLPTTLSNYSLPIGLKIQTEGDYNLSFTGMDTFANGIDLVVEDLKTGEMTTITDGATIPFHFSTGDNVNRFVLHINGVTGIPDISKTEGQPLIYTVNHQLMVKNTAKQALQGMLEVYDLSGRCIAKHNVNTTSLAIYNLQAMPGIYLVKIAANDGRQFVRKIFIK